MSPTQPGGPDVPVDVLVALPAHDEAETICGCLDAVVAALTTARHAGVVARARVAVAAHRCADATRERALARLVGLPGIESLVREDVADVPVGAVRTRLIRSAIDLPEPLSRDAWILSTDADTVVPADWVTGLLAAARASHADLVLGLAELDHWAADEPARQAYARLIADGIRGDQHEHVYAANLAVSWSAFDRVGGFPAVRHGEEHALVRAVRAAGLGVISPLGPRVTTSARMPGRAASGLGELLERLAGRTVDPPVGRGSAQT